MPRKPKRERAPRPRRENFTAAHVRVRLRASLEQHVRNIDRTFDTPAPGHVDSKRR